MTTAITSGIELDYTITGTGDPIVFIPGISLTQNVWGMSVPAFDGYQCITVDNRDAGGSPRAAAPYTAADMAQDVIALLERLDAGPAHLVGHSLGGAIAQEVCLAAPARVRSLVLVDTWATNDAYTTGLLELWKLFADQLVVQDDFQRGLLFFGVGSTTIETAGVENLIAGFQAGGPPQPRDAFKRQVDAALGHNTLDRLGEIGCPALLVRGDEDNFFPAKHAGQLRAGIHRSRVETIAGSGHSPLVENPPAFTRAVRRFLQAL